jgi:hypothetical protein
MSPRGKDAETNTTHAKVALPHGWNGDAGSRVDVLSIQRMYNRYLQQWALDALSLRRRGLDRPGLRRAIDAGPARPGRDAGTHATRRAA